MKLWIDDVRPAPEGYVWCKSVNDAYDRFHRQLGLFPEDELLIDIDHDAGDYAWDGGDFIFLLKNLELCYHQDIKWKDYIDNKVTFHIHSMNPVGVQNMRRIIQKNGWKEV